MSRDQRHADVQPEPISESEPRNETFLRGLRVIEMAGELGEFCGKILAGLGADVIKVEPPEGEATRGYGPFYQDKPDPDRSLHFWHYNHGKRSVVVDLDRPGDVDRLRQLIARADILIDGRPRGFLDKYGFTTEALSALNNRLIHARITAFGDEGPWADFVGSDLIHLALGGVMMNCGYDPEPSMRYDTPPMAPQMWQAYHICGEVTAIQILAALNYRLTSGLGQRIDTNVHDAVSKNTETDVPDWVFSRQPHYRQTCAHSFTIDPGNIFASRVPGLARTKDGRWLYPYRTYLPGFSAPFQNTVDLLEKYGCVEDLADPIYQDSDYLQQPRVAAHISDVIDRFISKFKFDKDLWRDAQATGMPWAPVRRPEENIDDPHWAARGTFADVYYPELGRSFTQVQSKWYCAEVPWPDLTRAPLLGEHNEEIFAPATHQLGAWHTEELALDAEQAPQGQVRSSPHGKPFALAGVRVVDLTWLLASGGAGRFFTAHGADVVKIEHSSRPDRYRMGVGQAPAGGRAEREGASAPIAAGPIHPDRGGAFMEINAGKRSLSLDLKSAEGRNILLELVAKADLVIEGFSPGTMDRMGLGYERLKEVNPGIIYIQQSGMGQVGCYGGLRSYGPTAQAFSGLSEMSGLSEPYAPAGIGYSYLDWFGAYQMANAMMAALYRRRVTGRGCWIDSSQVETGLYLTGSAILDFSVNGRAWSRYGNRSPYNHAAPHGVFRTAGEDRWLAVAAFDDEQWHALAKGVGHAEWINDGRFATLDQRLAHNEELDALLQAALAQKDGFALMATLQAARVPAGMCQTAEDRCDHDPQLRHFAWQVELRQSTIGTWPVKELTGVLSETPSYIGGLYNRSGPSYGEDSDAVLREWLGKTISEIDDLRASHVI